MVRGISESTRIDEQEVICFRHQLSHALDDLIQLK
jgi:hypothetical protein